MGEPALPAAIFVFAQAQPLLALLEASFNRPAQEFLPFVKTEILVTGQQLSRSQTKHLGHCLPTTSRTLNVGNPRVHQGAERRIGVQWLEF